MEALLAVVMAAREHLGLSVVIMADGTCDLFLQVLHSFLDWISTFSHDKINLAFLGVAISTCLRGVVGEGLDWIWGLSDGQCLGWGWINSVWGGGGGWMDSVWGGGGAGWTVFGVDSVWGGAGWAVFGVGLDGQCLGGAGWTVFEVGLDGQCLGRG